MNLIKFSIILPTWNRAFCISKMLNSILAQTITDYELIIVDDGSTDSTREFIKQKYIKELNSARFKYFKLDNNQGVSAARNFGLQKSCNSWICYADSDNIMRPDFLQTYQNLIAHNPNTKCFYTQTQFLSDKTVRGTFFDYEKLKSGNFIDLGVFVHHHDLYQQLGGFDCNLTRLVDWDLILRYTKYHKPVFLPKVVLDYNNSAEIKRLTNSENYEKNYARIQKKHGIENQKKGTVMIIYWLKMLKFLHLINKEKYNEKRAVALVTASPLFDAEWYMLQAPDVKNKKINAARHYVKYGWKEGRNPSLEFDGNAYLSANADITAAKINPLVHYLLHGAQEGRWYQKVSKNTPMVAVNKRGMLLRKIKNILQYPLVVKNECNRLKAEIRELHNKQV